MSVSPREWYKCPPPSPGQKPGEELPAHIAARGRVFIHNHCHVRPWTHCGRTAPSGSVTETFGQFWLRLITFGYFCLLLATFDYFLLLFATFCFLCLLFFYNLTTFCYFWLIFSILGYFRLLLITLNYLWQFLATFGYFFLLSRTFFSFLFAIFV